MAENAAGGSNVSDAALTPRLTPAVAHGTAPRHADRDRHTILSGRERFSYLVEATRCLADSLDYETALATAVGLALPYLNAWCIIDLVVDAEGCVTGARAAGEIVIRRVAILHPDPLKQSVARELHRHYPPKLKSPIGVPRALQTGSPEMIFDVTGTAILGAARNERHLALLRELGMAACAIVPITAHGELLGALTFVTDADGRGFGDFDMLLADDLARRAATALDHARRQRAVKRTNRAALQLYEEIVARSTRLQDFSAALWDATSEDDVAVAVFRHATTVAGAVTALIARLTPDGEHLEIVYDGVLQGAVRQQWRRFPVSAHTPMGDVVRTGEPLFLASREAWAARYPELVPLLTDTGHHANAILPLIVDGAVLGVFGAAYDRPRDFSEDDRAVVAAVVQQCARALARADAQRIRRAASLAPDD